MAAQLPAVFKAADITRFAHRAAQLEKVKPIVAYWCDYWMVNRILSEGLHNTDQESLTYTTALMDKLEQFKSQNAEETAITDDVAGKAYIEQFGMETFSRADNAVRANKASRQTADTFQASATFLDLLQIWGTIDSETMAKIKYAKYHALRIAKALNAGEDPNLSNPVLEPEGDEPELDAADVQILEGTKLRQASVVEVPDETHELQRSLAQNSATNESLHPSRDTSMPRQPSVKEVPDETDKMQSRLARQSSIDQSLHPSRAPSVPRPPANDVSPLAPQDAASFYTQNGQTDVSPINSPAERKSSVGVNLPSAPSEPTLPPPPTTFAQPPPPARHHGNFLPQPDSAGAQSPIIPPNFAPISAPRQSITQNPPQIRQATIPPPPPPHSVQSPVMRNDSAPNVVVDEEAIMKAQKHARWAISALNFEDVATAIRELRGALAQLGES